MAVKKLVREDGNEILVDRALKDADGGTIASQEWANNAFVKTSGYSQVSGSIEINDHGQEYAGLYVGEHGSGTTYVGFETINNSSSGLDSLVFATQDYEVNVVVGYIHKNAVFHIPMDENGEGFIFATREWVTKNIPGVRKLYPNALTAVENLIINKPEGVTNVGILVSNYSQKLVNMDGTKGIFNPLTMRLSPKRLRKKFVGLYSFDSGHPFEIRYTDFAEYILGATPIRTVKCGADYNGNTFGINKSGFTAVMSKSYDFITAMDSDFCRAFTKLSSGLTTGKNRSRTCNIDFGIRNCAVHFMADPVQVIHKHGEDQFIAYHGDIFLTLRLSVFFNTTRDSSYNYADFIIKRLE